VVDDGYGPDVSPDGKSVLFLRDERAGMDPWDIWTFDTSGGDPRRLSYVNADDPSPTWSPDGTYLAFWGGGGLYLVGSAGDDLRKVRELGGYGPLDWER
jgi:Tol biopolymer transport system component